MSEVLVIQHSECDPLGIIADALACADLGWRYVRPYQGQPVPQGIGGLAGLIVLGGPQSISEQAQYPFLADEMRLIEDALRHHRPVLGICLGGQILAAALGANVAPGADKEIGWQEITLSGESQTDPLWRGLPPVFTGFHWHGDCFTLPEGAVPLAASERTPCQAFRFGDTAYGIQFHPEVTGAILRDWVQIGREDLAEVSLTAAQIIDDAAAYLLPMQRIAASVFRGWAALAAAA